MVPLITVVLAVIILSSYYIESNFFLLGKGIYPVYQLLNKIETYLASRQKPITDTIVYSDYYTWYDSQRWSRGHSDIPLLGLYDSLDPKVIAEHSRLANKYGIDVFKVEYLPQLDNSILKGILDSDLGNTKVCLMYDSLLRFGQLNKSSGLYDFNNPEISSMFLEDMNHIADTYFDNENYFKIDGRPVLWIYIARDYTGPYKEIIKQARKNMLEKGYNVYLVGDLVFWNYKLSGINAFDAVSLYTAYGGRPQNTAVLAERLKFLYLVWKLASQMQGRDFIPAGIPAFDDSSLAGERKPMAILSGNGQDFRYQLKIVSNFLDAVNIAPEFNQVTIATFNEHQEGSSVEPTKEWGYDRIVQIPLIFGVQ
ncbi:MAG: glycoside hydrolase family 99-like domain-containing protein [Actinobacteria bacterium]|nr:glycoside hydrolase family 99-like domain-containing protein [Actinomycetota bacterium]